MLEPHDTLFWMSDILLSESHTLVTVGFYFCGVCFGLSSLPNLQGLLSDVSGVNYRINRLIPITITTSKIRGHWP